MGAFKKLSKILNTLWSLIPIIVIALMAWFFLKGIHILHRNFDYTEAQRQDYITVVLPETTYIQEPRLGLSLWERLTKFKIKPMTIQYVEYSKHRYSNLLSYVKADGKYITYNIRDCGELIGRVERHPYTPYFEIRTTEEGTQLIGKRDIFSWEKLWAEVGYEDKMFGKVGTSIEYHPMRVSINFYTGWRQEFITGISVRKVIL